MNINKLRSIRYSDGIVIGVLALLLCSKPPDPIGNFATIIILPLGILFFAITATICIKEKKVEHWSGTLTPVNHTKMYYIFVAMYLILALVLLMALATVTIELVQGKANLLK